MQGMRLRESVAIIELPGNYVQIGTANGASIMASNLDRAEKRWLRNLKVGGSRGHLTKRRIEIWDALREAGLLEDTSQNRLSVRVSGLGRIGITLVRLLSMDGIDHIDVRDGRPITREVEKLFDDDMKGVPRDQAIRSWLQKGGTRIFRSGRPHLAITIDNRVIDWGKATELLYGDIPHLPVIVDDLEVTIGPLSIPGITPCFQCVEAERLDVIPDWPAVREQLRTEHAAEPGYSLASAAAGLAAWLTLRLCKEGPADSDWFSGIAWTVSPTGVQTTKWQMRENCGCQDQ